jgi:GLPGLI family protein
MKKYLLYLLFEFVFLPFEIQAQYFNFSFSLFENLDKYNVVDSAYLKCSYQLTYLKDTLKLEEKSTDKQILLIGKTVSKYYSQYILEYNQFRKKHRETHENSPSIKTKGAWSYELFKNYPQGKETITDIASMLQSNYFYEEQLPTFNWEIANEKQLVLSYNCQKATMTFRGRDYIAWFTTDIPIPNGPWKFGGLPGLILKIADTKDNFIFECNGLEQLKKNEPIKFYKVEYNKTTRKDLYKLYRRFHEDMAAYLNAIGSAMHEIDAKTGISKQVEHASFKIPYNPIELE